MAYMERPLRRAMFSGQIFYYQPGTFAFMPSYRLSNAEGKLASVRQADGARTLQQLISLPGGMPVVRLPPVKTASLQISNRHLTIYCAARNLVRLPVEILQRISKHFTAQEWARGPSQTCSLLYNMGLPHIVLKPLLPLLNPSTVRPLTPLLLRRHRLTVHVQMLSAILYPLGHT